ncbi:hypothetical protein GCM10010358_69200 [Streptomyces minutiscleroticus]|uniref:Uncharacterized protein n=1 Tax=Streptomyces minutiscleroticus TaxID=68238 RepID=A0A918U767_9ACTN|nr:hypothetical protein GCM10010358_69200 [Streptomyces minutiscleroticus]
MGKYSPYGPFLGSSKSLTCRNSVGTQVFPIPGAVLSRPSRSLPLSGPQRRPRPGRRDSGAEPVRESLLKPLGGRAWVNGPCRSLRSLPKRNI